MASQFLALSSLRLTAATTHHQHVFNSVTSSITFRTFKSRAHPKPRPVFTIHAALDQVLEGIEERKGQREVNWVRRADQRAKKGVKVREGERITHARL